MSSERAGVHTGDPEGLAERYRASTGWDMAEGHAVTAAFLAGYQAVHTSHALNREKAQEVIANAIAFEDTYEAILDRLEACVVPDPRLARIEALPVVRGQVSAVAIRAILRGDQ